MFSAFIVLCFFGTFLLFSSAAEFQPQLTTNCANALSSLVEKLSPSGCGRNLSAVLKDNSMIDTCTTGVNGLDCFNTGAVYSAAQSSKNIVPVYRLPAPSQCTLCTPSNGMKTGCDSLLAAAVGAAFGNQPNYTAFGITNATTINQCNQLVQDAKVSCRVIDSTSVQILQYQSQLLCDSTNTFGMTVSSAGNIQGIVDMRAVTQCGKCAVVPCLPGQLCNGNGKATMCPEGYYCPIPAVQFKCPDGHFCPQGSTSAKKCRGIAASSCNEGAAREVVWVPLFIALLILLFIYCLTPLQELLMKSKESSVTDYNFQKLPVVEKMNFSTHSSLVSIEFKDIRLVTGKTTRIDGVTGSIRPGKFTAIIGGSGAGKTSLMNVILGREAATAGEISYYSDDYAGKIPAKLLDRIIAFVPQTDVYLREMTVYELIEHSARWRLPTFLSEDKIHERIEEVLAQLQLQHLRDITVGGLGSGSNNKQSITLSPGDRKKVNIALELVAGPNILFLDEPTSGIDSSSALNVAKIVSNLAKTGLTCVAVIHQPRSEIFSLIDDMIILQRGGRIAYQGPTKYVLQYFAMHGFHTSNPKANKTDFLIDITSKPPPKEVLMTRAPEVTVKNDAIPAEAADEGKNDNENGVTEKKVTWADLWQADGPAFLERMEKEEKEQPAIDRVYELNSAQPSSTAVVNNHPNEETVEVGGSKKDIDSSKTFVPLDIPRRGFFQQFYLSCKRGLQQHFKNNVYQNDLMIHLVAGIILGIVTCGGPLYVAAIPYIYNGSCPPGAEIRCNSWIRFEVGPATFLITMILGAVVIPGAIRTFGREKEVFSRESAVGANKLAYFLGKFISDLPFLVLNTFMFMAPMIAIAPWQAPADKMYGVLLCISFVVMSMGYWLSFIFPDPDAAVLTGVILAILLNLFSGFVPKIGDGDIGTVMYTHYSARAITAVELKYGQGVSDVSDFNSVVPDPWKFPNLGNDCAGMIVIGLVLLFLSFVTLLYRNQRVGKI